MSETVMYHKIVDVMLNRSTNLVDSAIKEAIEIGGHRTRQHIEDNFDSLVTNRPHSHKECGGSLIHLSLRFVRVLIE